MAFANNKTLLCYYMVIIKCKLLLNFMIWRSKKIQQLTLGLSGFSRTFFFHELVVSHDDFRFSHTTTSDFPRTFFFDELFEMTTSDFYAWRQLQIFFGLFLSRTFWDDDFQSWRDEFQSLSEVREFFSSPIRHVTRAQSPTHGPLLATNTLVQLLDSIGKRNTY